MKTITEQLEQLADHAEVALDRWVAGQLEFEPECQITPIGWTCDEHAVWVVVCVHCGDDRFCCQACRTGYEAYVHAMAPAIPQCVKCNAFATRIEQLFNFVPIRGAK